MRTLVRASTIIIITMLVVFEIGFLAGIAGNAGRLLTRSGQKISEVRGVTNEDIDSSTLVVDYIKNMTIIQNVASDYYKNHREGVRDGYIANVYDCTNMASDLWDQLYAQGINVKLITGNVLKDIDSHRDIDHAWVLAEVVPGKWVAVDAVSGTMVYNTTAGTRWYRGIIFDNPEDLMNDEYSLTGW